MKIPNIKSLVKKLKHFSIKRYIPHRVESIWFTFLIIFSLLTIALFIWSTSLFLQLNKKEDSLFASSGQSRVETINRAKLEDLLEELHDRRDKFEDLTSEIIEPVLEEDEEGEDEDGEEGLPEEGNTEDNPE